MPRKRSARCTEIKIKPPQTHFYEVIYKNGDQTKVMQCYATDIRRDNDYLIIYRWINEEIGELDVGAVRNWISYMRLENQKAI